MKRTKSASGFFSRVTLVALLAIASGGDLRADTNDAKPTGEDAALLSEVAAAGTKQESPLQRPPRSKAVLRELGLMPLQSGGRLKPLDTLARETIKIFNGRETVAGRHHVEVLLSMLFNPKFWEEHEFVKVDYGPLRKDLALPAEKRLFSLSELKKNEKLLPLFQALQTKEQNEEKLDGYFQAVSRIRNQFNYFAYLISGKLFAVVPPKKGLGTDKWLGLDELSEPMKVRFWLIAATFENADPKVQERAGEKGKEFISLAMAENPELYPKASAMELEAHYNNFRPWRYAWVLGIIAMILLSASLVKGNSVLGRAGMGFFLASMALQIYGFALRIMIAGRPPVTNMYESVIWVGFGCMLFGLILELVYRRRVVALCSLGFAVLCMILSDMSSAVLDASIHPLEPVLRSNFWLMIHVMTITLGYAAFALSLALGNLGLAPFVFLGRESKIFPIKEMALYAYRAVQVGVLLLGSGTILGGVWADYSWGRFWGWDPKETWALIAFLGYVAVLHARFRGMLRDFGFLAACIISFLLVVMAWYGVNFVLGAGLHSYGFSSGGNAQMFVYCTIQVAFVGYAIFLRNRALKAAA